MKHFDASMEFLDEEAVTTRESDLPALATSFASLPAVDQAPMDSGTAADIVGRLLDRYPNLNAHNPEGYMLELGRETAKHPKWAGSQAIEEWAAISRAKIQRREADFPPTVNEWAAILHGIMAPHRFSKSWDVRSAAQIAERPKVAAEPRYSAGGGKGTIYNFRQFDDAVAKHGRPIGAFEKDRKTVPYGR